MKIETRLYHVLKPEDLERWLCCHDMVCRYCGAKLNLWPPTIAANHVLLGHSDLLWPAATTMFKMILSAWRGNPAEQAQVAGGYVDSLLLDRFDYHRELVAAGIVAPARRAQG
jgi:hypothetical protein